MKRRTFQSWLRRYAEACVRLSWVGGEYPPEEMEEARAFWSREKRKAMQKIMALHTRWTA